VHQQERSKTPAGHCLKIPGYCSSPDAFHSHRCAGRDLNRSGRHEQDVTGGLLRRDSITFLIAVNDERLMNASAWLMMPSHRLIARIRSL